LSGLNHRLIIRPDKRQILAPEFEVKRTTLTRLETHLREASQTFSRRRDRSNEIADINQHRFLPRASACVLNHDAHRQLITYRHRLLPKPQVAVRKSRVTQPVTKTELRIERKISKRCVLGLEWFVIVIDQTVRRARVSEGKLAARINIAEQHIGDRRSTFMTRVVSHHDRIHAIRNAVDDPRTPFDEHEYDRFPRRF